MATSSTPSTISSSSQTTGSSSTQTMAASSSTHPTVTSSSTQTMAASSSSQLMAASASTQLTAASSSTQSTTASSSTQPTAASSSSQPTAASSSSQPTAGSSSSQPMSSASTQSVTSSSAQPMASASPHRVTSSPQMALSEQDMKDCIHYVPLYKAILEGDFDFVKDLCDSDDHALEASITKNLDTALHVAVGTDRQTSIVCYLLDKMPKDKVVHPNKEGNTVLSIAAIVGNVEAAKIIMNNNVYLNLTEVSNYHGWIPLIEAARHGQKEMIKYLLQFRPNCLTYDSATPSESNHGVFFTILLIIAGFYDLSLDTVKKYPSLATMRLHNDDSLLSAIAGKPSAFPSGKGRKPTSLWKLIILYFFPCCIKEIQETKPVPQEALQLVEFLCSEISKVDDYQRVSSILKRPLLLAAELGVCEVVEKIIKSFPDAIWFTNQKNHNAFQLAVINRREKVFNLIFQMSGHKHLLLISEDTEGNNILHLAGKKSPKNQLNLIPGAALQMQRELLWFKEVEKIVQPSFREDKNSEEDTPAMIFTKQHEELVKEGEKWMKEAATSGSVVSALIVTVAFAAAISVPGDYSDNGQPNFFQKTAFNIFGISNAISLFSSIAAIIMFMSILMARYAEDDFLRVLPDRLTLGLVMLFLSLTSMILAFVLAFYLVFIERKAYCLLVLVGASACLPVYMFVSSQYPLLLDLIDSTHGPGIFGKQSKSVLY